MNKNRAENYKRNRDFIIWVREADGLSELSVNKTEYDIQPFTEFMGNKNYKELNSDLIREFKESQRESDISDATFCSRMRNTKKLLSFLMFQPGFKRKFTPNLLSYMSPTAEEKRLAQIHNDRDIPSIESVIALHDSIPDTNPIGLRDRNIISILVTTGVRHKALITLPLGYVHIEERYINQDPRAGTKTKGNKLIKSAICNLDDRFIKSIEKWIKYLQKKGFSTRDPFIPKVERAIDPESYCFVKSTEVIPEFWKSHKSLSSIIRKRCKEAGIKYIPPHNFRHMLVKIAKEKNLTQKESKCFSQSIGHEHEATTWGCYGKFSDDEVLATVTDIDFQEQSSKSVVKEEEVQEYRDFKRFKEIKAQAKSGELK